MGSFAGSLNFGYLLGWRSDTTFRLSNIFWTAERSMSINERLLLKLIMSSEILSSTQFWGKENGSENRSNKRISPVVILEFFIRGPLGAACDVVIR